MKDHPDTFPTPEQVAEGVAMGSRWHWEIKTEIEERDRLWRAYIAEQSEPDDPYADFDPFGSEDPI